MIRQRIYDIITLMLFLIGCCMLFGCGNDIQSNTPLKESCFCGPCSSIVSRIIDGDTVELIDGTIIRYLLVDTPEKDQCFYQEAKNFNQEYVLGKEVELIYDLECTDNYDRTLAYMETEDGSINELLIARGFAKVLYIEPNGKDNYERYRYLEIIAKEKGLGVWNCLK